MNRNEYNVRFNALSGEERRLVVIGHWDSCYKEKRWGDLCTAPFFENHIGTASQSNSLEVADRRSGHGAHDQFLKVIPIGNLEK